MEDKLIIRESLRLETFLLSANFRVMEANGEGDALTVTHDINCENMVLTPGRDKDGPFIMVTSANPDCLVCYSTEDNALFPVHKNGVIVKMHKKEVKA